MSTTPRGIHLGYTFEAHGQAGAEIENPLFDLLSALREHGSISHAARASGQSYRHVWGSLKHWEEVLGNPLVLWTQGKRARLTPFAERLLWAERQARVRMTPHVEALRRELQRVFALADDATHEVLELAASHDLALPMLQTLAEAGHGLRLDLRFTGSEEALRSLLDGRCRVAGFHVPRLARAAPVFSRALRPLLKPGTHKLIGSHWRRQGLMHRPDTAPPALADLAVSPPGGGAALRFVNRQPGSGTRLLLDHLIAQAQLDPTRIDGYATRVEYTHLAVATAVASGAADVGLGIEAAARAHGLQFAPLVEEDYYLVCLKPVLESPLIAALRAALASPAWAAALEALPGYGSHRPGEVLSLTQALPWWRFARPKKR
ncbi:MAG: helix-turn-helix transcriptional regulator [Burkholderiales bacterium]|nr:helix-turn-helix transcriptional regulator [Burkholderiales bacterium]